LALLRALPALYVQQNQQVRQEPPTTGMLPLPLQKMRERFDDMTGMLFMGYHQPQSAGLSTCT